jgi:hypothetical protein
VPTLGILPEQKDCKDLQQRWSPYFLRLYRDRGVGYTLSIAQSINELPGKAFADFPVDDSARSRFIDTYIGHANTSQILEQVETWILGKAAVPTAGV